MHRQPLRWLSGPHQGEPLAERAPDPGVDRIREYARARVARTSLRKVAKSAGVKVGATKKFIDGSVPYERNARLWKRWYARELREGLAESPDDAVPTPDALAALDMLLWTIPEEQREAARADVVEAFRKIHQERAPRLPLWVVELTSAGGEG